MKSNVYCSSLTGNTKKLADALETIDLDEDVVYVGFWTDKSRCDDISVYTLKALKDKKIFLFGTCGYGLSEDYYKSIIDNTKKYIDDSNTVVGYFMCQGKMSWKVRERYEKMVHPNKQQLLDNFDMALKHPNDEDIENFKAAVLKAKQK